MSAFSPLRLLPDRGYRMVFVFQPSEVLLVGRAETPSEAQAMWDLLELHVVPKMEMMERENVADYARYLFSRMGRGRRTSIEDDAETGWSTREVPVRLYENERRLPGGTVWSPSTNVTKDLQPSNSIRNKMIY